MNNRIKFLRKQLNLTQEEFGNRIGVSKATISKVEKDLAPLTERNIKSICREFNVSLAWIKEGLGDMFIDFPEDTLDVLIEEYNLNEFDRELIKKYIQLTDEQREVIKIFIKSL